MSAETLKNEQKAEGRRFRNYINGEWIDGADGPSNTNPARPDEVLGRAVSAKGGDVRAAIESAAKAQTSWAKTSPAERSKILHQFANLLENDVETLAAILTDEEGKCLGESRGEVLRAASEARYMAGEALRLCGETLPSLRVELSARRERIPLGVIGAITPWNFPVVSPVRKIAPALACGDTVVFKPATLTPWTAVRIVELLVESGLPPGVVNLILGSGRIVGASFAESKAVRGISFTGSTTVGRALFQESSRTLKRMQLEMGGKNAALVYEPIDIDIAADEIVSAAFSSSGQRCTAISRVVVQRSRANELIDALVERTSALRVGDGSDPSTNVGPLVSIEQVNRAKQYCDKAVAEAARIACGGSIPDDVGNGYYFKPTVLTDVGPQSTVACEEVFGPVLSVLVADTVQEAIEIVNGTSYGLAACVFSGNVEIVNRFRTDVEVGMIHVNHGTASQPHVPFGGDRDSGFGPFSIGPTAKDFYLKDRVVYGI